MRLAYLYSRYPVLSQTFCDTEMLELERRGIPLLIGAIHSPLTSIRHGHSARLRAPICYAPPQSVLRVWEENAKANGSWPAALISEHDRKYGLEFKAATRARNALYFADLFTRRGIDRFHVHFANRAAHTAIFVKAIAGIPFGVTAHGQDFMADLGSDDLLREICREAEFVAVETDYSRGLLAEKCPDSAQKIHRVFNGMELEGFPVVPSEQRGGRSLRIVSIGRLVAFKGFNYLIAACAELRLRGIPFSCEIIGDGPLRDSLQQQITDLDLDAEVALSGALSQEGVRRRLRDCDLFVLASVLDEANTSDVFPTVILEAMASAKPVVSTRLAGIPESVLDNETGLLVAPRDSSALANAIERLARNSDMRLAFGDAGRRRIEEHFQVSKTIEPLSKLLHSMPAKLSAASVPVESGVAYLLDRWPDQTLSKLEGELDELMASGFKPTVIVCEFDTSIRLTAAMKKRVSEFVFVPDEMVIEADWQTHRAVAHQLEDNRANAKHRAPAALFLRAARYAVALRSLLAQFQVHHVHATNARALLCATMLQRLAGVTISAMIPATDPALPSELVQDCLAQCLGGRVADEKQLKGRPASFMLDPQTKGGKISQSLGLRSAGTKTAWQNWTRLLRHWADADASKN